MLVLGMHFAPFIDAQSFGGIAKGVTSPGDYMIIDAASGHKTPMTIKAERVLARSVHPVGECLKRGSSRRSLSDRRAAVEAQKAGT